MSVLNFLAKESRKVKALYVGMFIVTLFIPIIFIVNARSLSLLIDIIQKGNKLAIRNAIFYFFASQLLVESIWRIRDFLKIEFSIRVKMNIFNSVIDNLLSKSPTFFKTNNISSIVAISRYISEGGEKLLIIHFKAIRYIIYAITASYTLFNFGNLVGIIVLLWVILWLLVVTNLFPYISRYVVNLGDLKNKFLDNLSDTFRNNYSIFVYQTYEHEKEKLYSRTAKLMRRERKLERVLWYLWVFQAVTFTVSIASVLLTVMQNSTNIALEAGKFSMIIRVLMEFGSQMWQFSEDITEFIEAYGKTKSSLDAIEDFDPKSISKHEEDIDFEGQTEYNAKYQIETINLAESSKEIIFDQVIFLRDGKKFAFDCKIPANKNIALIGNSGSGKTTFIHLAMRILKPNFGSIGLYSKNFAYLPQEPKLFNASIKYNLIYGLNRNLEKDELEKITSICKLDFVKNLTDAYDTVVNDNLLSRGQIQRILIARCFLQKAEILFLDEPTSALDPQNEREIVDIIFDMPGTKLIVSHKPSSIEKADLIMLFKDGEIIDQGSYDYFKSKSEYKMFIGN